MSWFLNDENIEIGTWLRIESNPDIIDLIKKLVIKDFMKL